MIIANQHTQENVRSADKKNLALSKTFAEDVITIHRIHNKVPECPCHHSKIKDSLNNRHHRSYSNAIVAHRCLTAFKIKCACLISVQQTQNLYKHRLLLVKIAQNL